VVEEIAATNATNLVILQETARKWMIIATGAMVLDILLVTVPHQLTMK